MAFIDYTISNNIYLFLPIIFLFLNIKIGSGLYFIAASSIVLSVLYYFFRDLEYLVRFIKTYLLAIPLIFYILRCKFNSDLLITIFFKLNAALIYCEFIIYSLTGHLVFADTTIMLSYPRYKALFSDSNFFSYAMLCFIIYDRIRHGRFSLYLVGSILLSLSFSAIGILVFLVLFNGIFLRFHLRRLFSVLFVLLTSAIFILYYFILFYVDNLRDFFESSIFSFKAISMSMRLELQKPALNSILSMESFWFGHGPGSARILSEADLNLHNTYLQVFYEVGFISFALVIGTFIFLLKYVDKRFYPILCCIFLMGNIMEVFYFPLFAFIFYLSMLNKGINNAFFINRSHFGSKAGNI